MKVKQVFDVAYFLAIKLLEMEENNVLNRSEKGKKMCIGMIDK